MMAGSQSQHLISYIIASAPVICGGLFACFVVHLGFKCINGFVSKRSLRKAIWNKLSETKAAKRNLKAFLLSQPQATRSKWETIVQLPGWQLLEDIKSGQVTAVEALQAYQLKALQVDEKTNCITELLEEANDLSAALDRSGSKGPLHGLPISVKDNYHVKGHDCTLGLVQNLGKPVNEDAFLLMSFKEAGAVPFVKTNVPQTLLSYGCSNPVFGSSKNPVDPSRTTGGSSGGEAALIASGGSVLGLASDVGGSGRIPAHMCGIYGLKPTANRLSSKYCERAVSGLQGLLAAPTLMGQDVETIAVAMKSIVSPTAVSHDLDVVPLPFNENVLRSTDKLRVGYYEDDGFFTPTPGCKRAVIEAKLILERKGYELVQFSVPEPWKAYSLMMKLLLADGSVGTREKLRNDIMEPTMWMTAFAASLPKYIRKTVAFFVGFVSPRMAVAANETGRSAAELWEAMVERESYTEQFHNMWKELKLDALIAPGFPFPAPPHDYPTKIFPAAFTTMLYNMLNFPAGVAPITKETDQDQMLLSEYRTDDIVFKLAKKATMGAVGLPLGVQVVALPWNEEIVLRIMGDLEKSTTKSKTSIGLGSRY